MNLLNLKSNDIKHASNDNSVEIIAHKQATKKQVDKVKEANKVLNEVFEENHFSLKLVLASKRR